MLSATPHGEHAAIARLFTRDHGLQVVYVHGGRSRTSRPLLQPGSRLSADIERRGEGRLATGRLELVRSAAELALDALALAVLPWIAGLLADTLAEGDSHANLFGRTDAVLQLLALSPGSERIARTLAEYEMSLLTDLGFGLDLSCCAVTGARKGLAFVSPRTGRAVTAEGAAGYERQLLPLPAFFVGTSVAGPGELLAGLQLTRHFVLRDLVSDRARPRLEQARDLIDARLARLL